MCLADAAGEEYQGPPKVTLVPGAARKAEALQDKLAQGIKFGDMLVPVLVEVQPAWGVKRMPCDICLVIDISGSMGSEATLASEQSTGLTLLDIAKHGVRTVAASLCDEDRLSLVWFNHEAGQAFPLTKMNAAGRKAVGRQLDSIGVSGGTDIWLGLQQGLESLRAKSHENRMAHMMLLTDGMTTKRDTVMRNLQEYIQMHEQLPGTLSTFGFGYSIDSPLLVEISTLGDGTYSFIPDAGFVGTCFVNTLSNLLCTFGKEAVVSCEATDCEIVGVLGGYPMEATSEGARITLGTLQYQQRRSFVLLAKSKGSEPQLGANLTYQTETRSTIAAEFVEIGFQDAGIDAEHSLAPQLLRSRFIDTLAQITELRGSSLGFDPEVDPYEVSKRSLERYIAEIRASPSAVAEVPFVQGLLEDASGQATEATSLPEWWRKWGRHYLPSLIFAHRTQQCNNFKDPGVQFYGGRLFQLLQEAADAKFNALPAPKPYVNPYAAGRDSSSGGAIASWLSWPFRACTAGSHVANSQTYHVQPTSMAVYNNASSG